MVGGVFERFPTLRFVLTEQGASWVPGVLAQLDALPRGRCSHRAASAS